MITYEGKISPPQEGYIAIIVAKFNRTITQGLLDGALHKLREHGVGDDVVRICWVPGAFEIPLVAQRFTEDSDCSAVICLGAVIKGDTSHDEHINRAVSLQLADLNVSSGTPIIFGVLTCNTVEQAEVRSGMKRQSKDKAVDPTAGNKGAEAAEAALEMIDLLTELPKSDLDFSNMESFSRMLDSVYSEGVPNEFLGDDADDDDDYDFGFDDSRFDIFPPVPQKKKKKKKK